MNIRLHGHPKINLTKYKINKLKDEHLKLKEVPNK